MRRAGNKRETRRVERVNGESQLYERYAFGGNKSDAEGDYCFGKPKGKEKKAGQKRTDIVLFSVLSIGLGTNERQMTFRLEHY